MNNQLACAHDRIGELESSLRALEAERDGDSERAARVREAAEGAGRRKLTQKMYRLRGDAAVLEEGLEELDGEITAVRVRLFAERLVRSWWGYRRVVQPRKHSEQRKLPPSVMHALPSSNGGLSPV